MDYTWKVHKRGIDHFPIMLENPELNKDGPIIEN